MLLVFGYCAGVQVFYESVNDVEKLRTCLAQKKEELVRGDIKFRYGMMEARIASEVCVDVYGDEKVFSKYRHDFSTSFKK